MIDLIGNTPLIKLKYPSEVTGCNIYGKAEFMNPGGSVKDRAAMGIILDAEKNKLIEKGGTVVEGTFGNTGIALTMINNSRGYKTIIVMPDGASLEKREILTNLGAELRVVETKPYSDPGNYQHVSRRLVEELKDKSKGSVIWANQFDNTSNYLIHAKTTAKEIYNQLDGKIDGFTCAIGTGGTLAGTSVGLKDLDKNIRSVNIFDVFEGGNLPQDKKSIAISVSLQADDKTLSDNDLSQISKKIIKEVENKTGGNIRS